jgi:hypothetical protein
MSDFFGKLKSGAGKVAFEADKMGRLNKAQGELGQIKRQIEAHYNKLGELYYHQFVSQEGETPAFAEICAQIADLERQIGVKNEDIQRITAEVYNAPGTVAAAPQPPAPIPAAPVPPAAVSPAPGFFEAAPEVAAPPQTKFCTNCGKEMAAAVKFCPDCGNKM